MQLIVYNREKESSDGLFLIISDQMRASREREREGLMEGANDKSHESVSLTKVSGSQPTDVKERVCERGDQKHGSSVSEETRGRSATFGRVEPGFSKGAN
jgi:hypothetical protein